MKEAIQTKPELHPLLSTRFSPRSFDERPVEHDEIQLLMQAAQSAPSCYNQQPWQYIIASKDDRQKYDKMLNILFEKNKEWAQQAPLLMISVAKTDFDHNNQPNPYALYDVGQATAMMLVQAASMGLLAHQMGGFDKEAVKKEYQIPQGYEPVAAIAIGYRSEQDGNPSRNRKPIHSFVFAGQWQNSVFDEQSENVLVNHN